MLRPLSTLLGRYTISSLTEHIRHTSQIWAFRFCSTINTLHSQTLALFVLLQYPALLRTRVDLTQVADSNSANALQKMQYNSAESFWFAIYALLEKFLCSCVDLGHVHVR